MGLITVRVEIRSEVQAKTCKSKSKNTDFTSKNEQKQEALPALCREIKIGICS